MHIFSKDRMYYKFVWYNLFRSLRFFDPFIILYLTSLDISFTKIGVLYCIKKLVSTLLEIPSGFLADIIGRKKILILAYSAYIASFIIFFALPHFLYLCIGFILFGIGETFRIGTNEAILITYLEQKGWLSDKTEYYGDVRGWGQFGMAISSILGGIIVYFTHSYRIIFILSVIPYVINVFIIRSYPDELDRDKSQVLSKYPFENLGKELLLILKKPSLLRIIGNANLHASFLESIKDFMQPVVATLAISFAFLKTTNADSPKVGIVVGTILSIIFIISTFASRNAEKIRKAIGSEKLVLEVSLVTGLCLGVLSGMFYIESNFWMAILLYAFIYWIDTVRFPLINTCIADETPSKLLSTLLSFNAFVKALFSATFTLIFGVLIDKLGVGEGIITLSFSLLILYFLSIWMSKVYLHLVLKSSQRKHKHKVMN